MAVLATIRSQANADRRRARRPLHRWMGGVGWNPGRDRDRRIAGDASPCPQPTFRPVVGRVPVCCVPAGGPTVNAKNKKTPTRWKRRALGERGCRSILDREQTFVYFHKPGFSCLVVDLPGDGCVQRQVRRLAVGACPQLFGCHCVNDRHAVHRLFGVGQDFRRGVEHAQLLLCWGLLGVGLGLRIGRLLRASGSLLGRTFARRFLGCHRSFSIAWKGLLRSPMTASHDHQLPRDGRDIQRHFKAIWKGLEDEIAISTTRSERPRNRSCCVVVKYDSGVTQRSPARSIGTSGRFTRTWSSPSRNFCAQRGKYLSK